MLVSEDVSAMLRLREFGWGVKRIARELGVSPNTVRRYVERGGWAPFQPRTYRRALDGLDGWLAARLRQHRGNAVVVHEDLATERDLHVSVRTVQRAVEAHRRMLRVEGEATLRFETPPGRQLQVDFGQCVASIGGERTVVHLLVATLGYSRRIFVAAFPCEQQAQWLAGIEGAFEHFGGVTEEVLCDNARALVDRHDVRTGEVRFHRAFLAFCTHWGTRPRACAPYRARTKGKDERAVQYVKRNAIAGREFASWSALEAHLVRWMRDVADVRVHGTTHERPLERFAAEARALRPLAGRTRFQSLREVQRQVQRDCCVELDTNWYSVPYRLLGRTVMVRVSAGEVRVLDGVAEVAHHAQATGTRQRVIDPEHLAGVIALLPRRGAPEASVEETSTPALLRPLSEYEAVVGGAL